MPGPLSFDEIAPVVLLSTPAAIPVTFRLMLHEAFAARLPPVRLMEDEPAAAVVVPPHELVSPLGDDTCKPAGNASVNAIPVRPSEVFGF